MTAPAPVPGTGRSRHPGSKELRCLLKACEAAGATVEPYGRTLPGHWKVTLDGRFIGGLSGTPSDHRTRKNDIARLRRNGLQITTKGTYDGPATQSER